MEIKVERDHIDNGFRQGCTSCPIALAANQTLQSLGFYGVSVNVSADWMSVYGFEIKPSRTVPGKFHTIIGDEILFLPLPPIAKKFIRDFDDAKYPRSEFQPFSFELPMEVLNELNLRI